MKVPTFRRNVLPPKRYTNHPLHDTKSQNNIHEITAILKTRNRTKSKYPQILLKLTNIKYRDYGRGREATLNVAADFYTFVYQTAKHKLSS
jgi:hypothetical protein